MRKTRKTIIKRRATIFGLILSLTYSLGLVVLVIVMNLDAYQLTGSDTTEYKATVTEVKLPEEGTTQYITIGTEEYGDGLSLSGIPKSVDINDVMGLQSGQSIFFRIDNLAVDLFEEQHVCWIIALRTSEKEILSIEDYNASLKPSSIEPTITGIVGSILLFLVAIHCLLKLRKPTKQNEQNTATPLDVNQEAP